MESLLRIQEDIVKKINRGYSNFKKSPKQRLTIGYMETRLDSLEQQWSTFSETHQKLVGGFSKEIYESSEYYKKDVYDILEDLYTDYKTELKENILNLQRQPTVFQKSDAPTNSDQIKLPKISIPNFSGKYCEWISFRDLFLSLVHNNKTLQNVQKLHYLKSYLTGEAEQLLRHLPITNDNYLTCWELLENRFNNKRYLTNSVLKRFFSQKNIVNESSNATKELFDTSKECLNALVNIGIKIENWDVMIIYILSLKLDNESRKLWEAKVCSSTEDLPTSATFFEFLEHRFRSLEFLNAKTVKGTQSHHVVTNDSVSKTVKCSFCSDCTHKIGNCKRFSKEEISIRRKFVQDSGLCFNCLGANHSVTACRLPTRCRICKKKHHSLLHLNNPSLSAETMGTNKQSAENANVVATATTSSQDETITENINTCFSNTNSQVLLATALVNAETNTGSYMTLRSLLDQGSQASFITESAVQLLGLNKIQCKSVISGVGGDANRSLQSKHVVYVKLQSIQDPTFSIRIKAHVLYKLTSFLPERRFVANLWPNLPKMKLADSDFNIPNKIDMLLGAEVYCQVLTEGLIRGSPGTLIAQNTKLGWIISGKVCDDSVTNLKVSSNTSIFNMHVQLEEVDLKKFWELESDGFSLNKKEFTPEELRCESIYRETTRRDSCGRYIVRLPFRDADPKCKSGNSLEIAKKRLFMLEKRFCRSPDLKVQYSNVISEYIQLGHMEVVPQSQIHNTKTVYLPHHAIIRTDRTTSRCRVVFDASCRDSNGVSFNSDLMVGPKLQPDLRHIIMKWRLHPISLVADIVKMYRQIKVADEDTDCQRLVWRTNVEEDIQHLRLTRVTFGVASAPYLAVKTLCQVAYDEGEEFPLASKIVLSDFFMDDLLTGCNTVAEGKQIFQEMNEMLSRGGFELQKWSSNNNDLLSEISKGKEEAIAKDLRIDEKIKILGLTWNRSTDDFEYSVQLPEISEPVTKRKVISDIAKLFDPMGWIAPAIIKAKIIIQRLWLSGIAWDEELPPKLKNDWIIYREELIELTNFKLPRWIHSDNKSSLELHGFSDASSEAYAAVVYARVITEAGDIQVHLLTSKSKVAPIKQVSIPRLELCGAVMVAKLLQEVSTILNVQKPNIHAWTDSTVVLAWLSSHPSRWKTFVGNRVSEILNILDRNQWSHVSSKDNPADYASRGVSPSECLHIQLWRIGPAWLRSKTISYNNNNIPDIHLEEKSKKIYHVRLEDQLALWTKFSSLQKLVRVLAYCRRYISILKTSVSYPTWLTSKELNVAMVVFSILP